MAPFARGLCLVLLVPTLACSGEDDDKGGNGAGLGAGASAGAAGSGNLVVGGRAGAAGKAGTAGAAGAAGSSAGAGGIAGVAGVGGVAGASGAAGVAGSGGEAGIAGVSGAGGIAGAGGAGAGGASGSGGSSGAAGVGGAAGSAGAPYRASTAVCGNGKLEPGERCDGKEGKTDDLSCADILNDPKATGTPTCVSCFPSFEGCVSCKDGTKNGDETDIDCGGGGGCGRCGLGLACKANTDCAPLLGCVGGVCNQIIVEVGTAKVQFAPTGSRTRVPVVVRGVIPLPATATVLLQNAPGADFESASPADPSRLVALVPTGAPGVVTALLSLEGNVFPVALPRAEANVAGTRTVTAISGRLGTCASLPPAAVPLVLEAVPTGATPALELPVGRPFCLRIKSSTTLQFPVEAFLGGSAVARPKGAEISPTEMEFDFVVPPTPLFEARNGNTPIQLTVRYGAQSMAASTPLTVLSPYTTRVGANGAGTTSSPAAPTYDFVAMGAPFVRRTVWQIAGPHAQPPSSLKVPDNLVVQGIDDTASLDATAIGGAVTLRENAALRDLDVVGFPGPTGNLTGTCLAVTGTGNYLHGVTLRGCQRGIHMVSNTGLIMAGVLGNGMSEVSSGLSGENNVSFTAIDTNWTGSAPGTGNGVDGFGLSTLTLVRPKLATFQNGINADANAKVALHAPTFDVNLTALRLAQAGTGLSVGGTLTLPGTIGSGVHVGSGSVVEVRGLRVVGAGDGGLTVSGGTLDVTATVLRACGTENTAAASSASGGSFTAHGLRIEQPGQIGLFALKDNGSISLADVVIEGATEHNLWVFGGTAKLRTVLLLDPNRRGLTYGDPAAPLDALDLDVVRHLPSEPPGALVFSDRAGTPTDVIRFRHLRAGDGADVASVPGNPVCSLELTDPVGGRYVQTNGSSAEPMCF